VTKTIADVMRLFAHEYPGRFSTTPERAKIWRSMLREFDREVVLAAAYDLASTCDWPPTIAQMRRRAVDLTHGELREPDAGEAWERVSRLISGEVETDSELSGVEREALRRTGQLWDLKRSSNPSADRAAFQRAFTALVEARRRDRLTLPEVRELAARRAAPALPEEGEKAMRTEKNG